MISLGKLLSGTPILINKNIKFYQPTLQEIVDMGENTYWAALNVWLLKRKDMVKEENEHTQQLDDFELWKAYVFATPALKQAVVLSTSLFLKEKIEFFEISNTMFIGEKESGIILDSAFYFLVKEICGRLIERDQSASKESVQYQETDNMSERERRMIEKMRASEKTLEEAKKTGNERPEDHLGSQILSLVSIGHYTFEQVYGMTMLQFNRLLKKYVDIQSFELRTMLSPYISSDDAQENTFWVN